MYKTIQSLSAVAAVCAAMAFPINARAQCSINMTANQQVIDGYGFSSAWCGQLSSAKNNALYNTLGFSLLRIRIDPNRGWTDETVNAQNAHAAGAKVLGTPWSPPANMKDNNNVVHGSLLPAQYGNYANHLRDAANTIGLDWVSIQNEPDWDPNYEGCVWTAAQLQTFARNNAPAIGKPVVMPECVGFRDDYSDPTLNDSTAVNNISIVAGHFYGNGNYVHQNALNHGKHVWETEHYLTGGQSDFNVCMQLAKEVADAMNNQFSAYFWWWVNDSQTDGTDLVNSSGAIIKPGYILGQFAKWIRPGSTRVTATYNPQANVYVTAYRVNGVAVIVAVNMGTGSVNQQFVMQNGNAATLEGYRTSSSQSMSDVGSFTVSSGNFTANLPAQSVTTFVQTSSASSYLGVTFYQDYNYGGAASQTLQAGSYTTSQLGSMGVPNDWASSVRIPAGWTVIMYASDNFSGTSWTVTGDTPNFGSLSPSANDQMSSCVIRVGGTYKLIARHSGKAMDASGAGTANGTQIIQWTYGGGNNQRWTVTHRGNGEYSIIGVQSGRCVDVSNWGTTNGTKVQLWDWLNGTNQRFTLTSTGGGYYRLTPTHATGSCLDVSGVSTADGANVQLWQWLNGNNQQWSFQSP